MIHVLNYSQRIDGVYNAILSGDKKNDAVQERVSKDRFHISRLSLSI